MKQGLQEKERTPESDQRYLLLDTLRGILLLGMAFYHKIWDLKYLFHYDFPWFTSVLGYVCQQSICWSFILLSGYCMGLKQDKKRGKSNDVVKSCQGSEASAFSGKSGCENSNTGDSPKSGRYKRGLEVLLAGLFITLVTMLFFPEMPNIFGVLWFLGSAMVSTALLRNPLGHIAAGPGLLFSATAFFLLRNINDHALGFESLILAELPDSWYRYGLPGAFLGLPGQDFYSVDYFSFFPWYFLFLTGYFFYRIFPAEKFACLFNKGNQGLAFLGKNSLLFYLLHQPLILVLLYLSN